MKRLFSKLMNHLSDGEYKEFLKILLIIFPFFALIIILIVLAITFASKYIEVIIFLVIMILCFVSCLFQSNTKKEEKVKVIPKSQKPIQIQHQLITECMYHIFKNLNTQLHIAFPNFESQIKDKIPFYTDNATNVTYFRYNIIANGEPLEDELFKEILNQGMIQALSSSTSKLGKPTFEHDGNHYQKLMIDELSYTGASWLIVVAIVDNDYAAVLEDRLQSYHYMNVHKNDFTFYNDKDF